jgi:hypothetical protein
LIGLIELALVRRVTRRTALAKKSMNESEEEWIVIFCELVA